MSGEETSYSWKAMVEDIENALAGFWGVEIITLVGDVQKP